MGLESEGIEGERMGKTGRGRESEIEIGRDSGGESLRREVERMGEGERERELGHPIPCGVDALGSEGSGGDGGGRKKLIWGGVMVNVGMVEEREAAEMRAVVDARTRSRPAYGWPRAL